MNAQTQITGWLTPEDYARAASLITGRERIRQIAKEVSEASGVPVTAILGRSKAAENVQARRLVWFIARREGMTFPAIARASGHDHTTVQHGVRVETARREARA